MSSKFLDDNDSDIFTQLTNGSLDIDIASATIQTLVPNQWLKTDGDRLLTSGAIQINDVNKLQSELDGKADKLQTPDPNDNQTIAIGDKAGQTDQGSRSIAIGLSAGNRHQQLDSIAIGTASGFSDQKSNSIAIGNGAGLVNQQESSIAIGRFAGSSHLGRNSIAIGTRSECKGENSITINSTNLKMENNKDNALMIAPVRTMSQVLNDSAIPIRSPLLY